MVHPREIWILQDTCLANSYYRRRLPWQPRFIRANLSYIEVLSLLKKSFAIEMAKTHLKNYCISQVKD
jgi:hypothetical protein